MVEPVTLGLIVAALVAKGLDRAEDEAVDRGAGVMRGIVNRLRERFSKTHDEDGMKALEQLAAAPDSPSRVKGLADVVDERSEHSSELRLELEAMIREAKDAGVDVEAISQVAVGNQNVQIAKTSDSEINVSFGGGPSGRRSPPKGE